MVGDGGGGFAEAIEPLRRYEVTVTVESTCTVFVRAGSDAEALEKAKAAYATGECDVDVPHQADWVGAAVEREV